MFCKKPYTFKFVKMINQYAKCLILLMLVGAGACFAATPFTPRHPDPVHESMALAVFSRVEGARGVVFGAGWGWQFFVWDG